MMSTAEIISLVSTIISLLLGILIRQGNKANERIEKDVTTCVNDTKQCNANISALTISMSKTDASVLHLSASVEATMRQLTERVNKISDRQYEQLTSMVELTTREKVKRGDD